MDAERLRTLVRVHAQAIKAMAVWDEELFRIFIDYLPFETSEGTMTGAALKQYGEALWVNSVPRFKQLRSLFLAQGQLLICTGYTSDQELIEALTGRFDLPIRPLSEDHMTEVLEEAAPDELRRASLLLQAADNALRPHDCQAQLCRFFPTDLPALYAMSDQVQFLRQVQSAQEHTSGIFSDALASMLAGVEETPLSSLYLNANNTLIRRLMGVQDRPLLEQTVKILYVQALLAGGHPLQGRELHTMNQALLALLERITSMENMEEPI